MKKMNSQWFACTVLLLAAVGFSAWRAGDTAKPATLHAVTYSEDTSLPGKKEHGKKEYNVGDLDRAMKELDKAMLDMDKTIKIDFGKMEKEMKLAMDEVKKINFEKIAREVEASLQKVDWEKAKVDVSKALHEAEIQVKEVDMKKIEKDLARAKEHLHDAKIHDHLNMEKMKQTMHEGLEKARIGMERAKKELKLLKAFTDLLEKDGLIDKRKGYKIEIKDGEMFINGIKQSKEVNDKYRKYFKEEDYSIKSDGDEISSI